MIHNIIRFFVNATQVKSYYKVKNNKGTEASQCHFETNAFIIVTTVFSYRRASPSGLSARQIGQPVPILTTLSTQVAQKVRRRLVARSDTPHSSCLQLLPVSPLTWKSYQSLQQVMPWPTAGRLRHLRWRTRCGVSARARRN